MPQPARSPCLALQGSSGDKRLGKASEVKYA